MNPIFDTHEPRLRQSCESCRRKKVKCTAEKPRCSLCRRLRQQCDYLPRGRSRRYQRTRIDSHTTTGTSEERIERLESEISHLYDLVQYGPGDDIDNGQVSDKHVGSYDDSRAGELNASSVPTDLRSIYSSPPIEVLKYFIEIYRTKIHMQPLPLFDLSDIQQVLSGTSQFLLWSFLSLTLKFSSHQFYGGKEPEAIAFYTRSAEDQVMKLAVEGATCPKVSQSLCLLALSEIKDCKFVKAWMIIGTAARFEAFRNFSTHLRDARLNDDLNSRCFWSVFLLERTFSHQFSLVAYKENSPKYPRSAPPPIVHSEQNTHIAEIVNSSGPALDPGIVAYYIQAIEVWGDIVAYLRDIRLGKFEIPWLTSSTYSQINVKVYDLEARLSPRHLLKNVRLTGRPPEELTRNREYWTPWLLMQMASHAGQAVLNHPFIHLFALRRDRDAYPSSSFLQQTVDQALFHSGWVVRLLQIYEQLEYPIHDPVIGDLVGTVATIPWLFQYSMDGNVSHRAERNLGHCESFLHKLSSTWPHLSRKLEIIQTLQPVCNHELQECFHESAAVVTFDPTMFWVLLDCCFHGKALSYPTSQSQGLRFNQHSNATLPVTTNLVHPLVEEQKDHEQVPADASDMISPRLEGFGYLSWDDLFPPLPLDDIQA